MVIPEKCLGRIPFNKPRRLYGVAERINAFPTNINYKFKIPANPFWGMTGIFYLFPNCQKATALAAATFNESTPWDMGIFTV